MGGDSGPAADPVRQLTKLTGGTSLLETDPQRWALVAVGGYGRGERY